MTPDLFAAPVLERDPVCSCCGCEAAVGCFCACCCCPANVHWTPEEHDQPACDTDDPGFGTLNPRQITCETCRRLEGSAA